MSESNLVVIKFGGTSVATAERWDNIKTVIEEHRKNKRRVIVVCSAPSGVSNLLETLLEKAISNDYFDVLEAIKAKYTILASSLGCDANEILLAYFKTLTQLVEGIALIGEVTPRLQARVMAFGELMLTSLGEAYLKQQGVDVNWQDARQWLKVIDNKNLHHPSYYLEARCDTDFRPELKQLLDEIPEDVILLQGFIANNADNETVLLGRGGSDSTAAYLAANLKAERCEIWTDVPGIYTANPRHIPEARLLKHLDYDEAQEIASMGAKVLHPNCINPVKRHHIPLYVKYTPQPQREGTMISLDGDGVNVQIKSILTKSNIMLVTVETLNMWQQAGFLADIFNCFKRRNISIDLVSTSETSVTVSLDSSINSRDSRVMSALLKDLSEFAKASVIAPCASISLVGHNIRAILHQLGGVFSVFEEQKIHLLSQAANDLNLTFVVDEDQVHRVAQKLHTLLIEQGHANYYFNQSWQQEFGQQIELPEEWWQRDREKLLALLAQQSPAYVYQQDALKTSVDDLKQCDAIDKIFYAMKANNNQDILQYFYQQHIGFECVSLEEIFYLQKLFPDIDPTRIIFTPNFAPKEEYQQALTLGVTVIVDSIYPFTNWPEVFSGKNIFIRIDPGKGYGHHRFVVTGGNESKFGIPLYELEKLRAIAAENDIHIVGLHTHSGSGILNPKKWQQASVALTGILSDFPEVRTLNLGGGLGIVEKPGQKPLDLTAVNKSLHQVKSAFPGIKLWIEPGRYLVGRAGALLATVTQVKQKGEIRFVGIDTGMNSLIRPALYGSYHEIVNLTRIGEPKTETVNIVGPICESGDTLGYSRLMPKTYEGDVILIANTGAYGRCMSSEYNLRLPAGEIYVAD